MSLVVSRGMGVLSYLWLGGLGVLLLTGMMWTPAAAQAAEGEGQPARAAVEEDEDPNAPALDPAVIKEVIMARMAGVKYCYNQELKKDPGLAGKVVMKFLILPKGSVTKVEVKESTLKNKEVEGCMVKEIEGWQFPEPRRGETVPVAFPFVFKGMT